MVRTRVSIAALAVPILVLAAGPTRAEVWSFVGGRYQAMGGAGVAVVDDSLATYWNPAALAYKKGWDVQLPATMNYSIENNALQKLGEILAAADRLESEIDKIAGGVPLDPAKVVELLTAFKNSDLPTLGLSGESMAANVGIGLTGHVKRFGVSALSLTNANIVPVFDQGSGIGLSNAIANVLPPDDGTFPVLSDTTGLPAAIQALTGPNGSPTAEQAAEFVSLFEQAGFQTSDPDDRGLILNIAQDTVEANGTVNDGQALGAIVQGLSTQEFGISYAHPLPMPIYEPLDGRIAIGGVLKYMLGVSYFQFAEYDAGQGVNDLIGDLVDTDNVKVSHNVGLDLGLLAQPTDWMRVGLVARNVNSPTFDASGSKEFELEPQVRMGLAFMPLPYWIVAADIDLTENSSLLVPNFDSRLLSLGTEYTLPIPWVTMIVRAGGSVNVAPDQNNDFMLSGGLGFRFGNFLLDLTGAGAFNGEEFATSSTGTDSLPTRLSIGLNLSWQSRPEGTRRHTGRFDAIP